MGTSFNRLNTRSTFLEDKSSDIVERVILGLWKRADGCLKCYDYIEIDNPVKLMQNKKGTGVMLHKVLFQQKDTNKYFFFTK